MVRFDYYRPANLSEALSLLADRDQPKRPMTYGSDLLVWTKTTESRPEAILDLSYLPEISRFQEEKESLIIGPGVTLGQLNRNTVIRRSFPALAKATDTMGSVQLREGASLGGNICTSSPAGDTAPPLLCYEARMIVESKRGQREIAADDFYTGPGSNVMEDDELLVGIKLPWPQEGSTGTYLKGARRLAVDLALVSVAAVASPSSETPSGISVKIALGAVAPTPIRAKKVEELMASRGFDNLDSPEFSEEIAKATQECSSPIDDIRSPASYRKTLVGELAVRAITEIGTIRGENQS